MFTDLFFSSSSSESLSSEELDDSVFFTTAAFVPLLSPGVGFFTSQASSSLLESELSELSSFFLPLVAGYNQHVKHRSDK